MIKNKNLFLLLTILLLTGCWNYRELNSMAIVGSIGVDFNEKDNNFKISVQVFNANKKSSDSSVGSTEGSPIIYYEAEAKTIHEALRKVTTESPKKLYIGHIELLIFGEDLLKEHFEDSIDFFLRDSESRKNFNFFTTKGCKASDVLKILTPLETTPSESLSQTLISNSDYRSTAIKTSFDEAISFSYNEGVEVVLPAIEIIGDPKDALKEEDVQKTIQKTILKINSNAILKNNKLIGFLSPEESFGFAFITSNVIETVISFPCDENENFAVIEITETSSKVKVDNQNEIVADITVSGDGALSEISCKIDLNNIENILKLEKMANEQITKIINKSIDKVLKDFNSDIFGFGNYLFRNKYKYWQTIKNDWNELFPTIKTNVTSNIKIINKGSIINSSKEG